MTVTLDVILGHMYRHTWFVISW